MDRITLDHVLDAVEASGITLVKGKYLQYGEGFTTKVVGACALCQLGIKAGTPVEDLVAVLKDPRLDMRITLSEKLELTQNYVLGFIAGFDGLGLCGDNTDYSYGYDDGKAIADTLFATPVVGEGRNDPDHHD